MAKSIFRKEILLAILSLLMFADSGCRSSRISSRGTGKVWNGQLKTISQTVVRDYAVVGRSSAVGVGAPVLVFEETHDSRPNLIELAIVLNRLHARYGVRNIVLEGYLQDEPKLDASWFNRLTGTTAIDRAEVAAQLLEEGEISAPEFMTLVYPDIQLVPGEVGSEYKVQMKDGALDAALDLSQRVRSSKGNLFADRIDKVLREPIDAEDEIKMAEGLEDLRISKKIVLSPESLSAWQSWIAFWRGRAGSNKTMADAALSVSSDADSSAVVLNIGVAHTQGVSQKLKDADRPYAVITPLALQQHDSRGQIDRFYELKEQRKSIQPDGGLMTAIDGAGKKPQAVVNEPWVQRDIFVREFTREIATAVLGPKPLAGNSESPFGFAQNQFETKLVSIDQDSIATVQDGSQKDVVFRFVLLPIQGVIPKTYWMKATLDSDTGIYGDETDSIEFLLTKILVQAQAESDAPYQAEDSKGVIRIGGGVSAVFGSTKEEVVAKNLRTPRSNMGP